MLLSSRFSPREQFKWPKLNPFPQSGSYYHLGSSQINIMWAIGQWKHAIFIHDLNDIEVIKIVLRQPQLQWNVDCCVHYVLQCVSLLCSVRQYTYWLDSDMLDHLQPNSRVFHTWQHSTWMDDDICVHNWWYHLCLDHYCPACFFILEIPHHALCPLVWFPCKWVVINFINFLYNLANSLGGKAMGTLWIWTQ